MDKISVKRAIAAPAILTGLMLAIAAALSWRTGVEGSRVFLPYLSTWAAVALISVLCWVFVQVVKLAPTKADRPLQTVIGRISEPCRLLVLPALIFPLFLAGYTWAKCSIPFAVGYHWERTWADADRLLLGQDAWLIAHAILPDRLAPMVTFFYSVIWGFALVFSGALVASFCSRRFTATFFTALMMSWLLGGIAMAFAISAAGPVFAHLTDPELVGRFALLRGELARLLGPDDAVLMSQRYLAAGMDMKIAAKGGGISAMPSMHIATATILVIAAWRTMWLPVSVAFWLMTLFGSVYLGYHYALDAPVAAIVAGLCWIAARQVLNLNLPSARSLEAGPRLARDTAPGRIMD